MSQTMIVPDVLLSKPMVLLTPLLLSSLTEETITTSSIDHSMTTTSTVIPSFNRTIGRPKHSETKQENESTTELLGGHWNYLVPVLERTTTNHELLLRSTATTKDAMVDSIQNLILRLNDSALSLSAYYCLAELLPLLVESKNDNRDAMNESVLYNREQFAHHDGHFAVTRAMMKWPSCPDIQSMACRLLFTSLGDDDSIQMARECGATEALMNAIRAYPKHVDLIKNALGALDQLLQETTHIRQFLSECNVLPILAALDRYLHTMEIQLYGCNIVWSCLEELHRDFDYDVVDGVFDQAVMTHYFCNAAFADHTKIQRNIIVEAMNRFWATE